MRVEQLDLRRGCADMSDVHFELCRVLLTHRATFCLPGSEWRYVIISTVCSVAGNDIVSEPDGVWLSKHLGFVGDPNQINVAITRAKEGLCIIGEKLRSSWSHVTEAKRGRIRFFKSFLLQRSSLAQK